MALKNRFFMAPVKTAMALPGGVVTPDSLSFYQRIARGGVAAIILEPMSVSADGREHPKQLCVHKDEHVDEIKKLVQVIHANGALVGVHLNHAGRAANPKVIGGSPVAPSPMLCPTTGAQASELDAGRIASIIRDFGAAAGRAVEAGADFIEVQFGHGYLVSQFYSPRTNKRRDDWGGTPEKRLRFARAVLESVKKSAAGRPVIVRISGKEFVEDGLAPENMVDLLQLIRELEAAAIHVGYGNACDNPPWYYNHMAMPEEKQLAVLGGIRDRTPLPIIAVGRMGYVPKMKQVLDENLADYIALGRPLLADPDLPQKLALGREDEIVLCGGCLEGCLRAVKRGEKIRCIVNPEIALPEITSAKVAKKVMIVGAGPAGIAAAVHLARKGHRVSLYEKEDDVGGQFNFAPAAPIKKQMQRMLESVKKQLNTVDIDLHTGIAVTAELVRRENPDVLVVATGSRQKLPPIENLQARYYLTSLDFYAQTRPVKGHRVLVVGLGMIGLETVAILAGQGKEVVGVEPLPQVAADMEPITRNILLKQLSGMPNVMLLTETFVKAFTKDGVLITEKGRDKTLPAVETTIIATGMQANRELAEELSDWSGKIYIIGDAEQPANIENAFRQGISLVNEI